MRNLFLGYFHTPRNKRAEVLRLMGNVVGLERDDVDKVSSPVFLALHPLTPFHTSSAFLLSGRYFNILIFPPYICLQDILINSRRQTALISCRSCVCHDITEFSIPIGRKVLLCYGNSSFTGSCKVDDDVLIHVLSYNDTSCPGASDQETS